MPLADSGAALFAGSGREFAEWAPASRLTAWLTEAFRNRWGTVGESEVRSWKNSLTSLASVVKRAGLESAGVGVEFKLPLTSRRLDAFFVGEHPKDGKGVVLVELKQWSDVGPSSNPDNVFVHGMERVHPSVQAGSYAEHLQSLHSAFTEDGFFLRACAYLHNLPATQAPALRGIAYAGAVSTAPFYVSGEEDRLGEYLAAVSGSAGGLELLPKVLHGRYRPSMKLVDAVAQSLKGKPAWTLLDEQRLAFNVVRGMAARARERGEKSILICTGGPGTGKSVIAVHLLLHLLRDAKCRAVHATGSKAFTTNLRALAPRTGELFHYFNDFMPHDVKEGEVDVLICDEAHRIRKTSNRQFKKRSEISQTEELIRATRVAVFFLDERQNVRPDEIGSPEAIEETARWMGVPVQRIALDAQFRCNGCPGYVAWVDALFSPAPQHVGTWHAAKDYDVRLFEHPHAMEEELKQRGREGSNWRIVAGFCWPWTDPAADGSLVPDVEIEGWKRPWNAKSPEQCKPARPAPRPDRHPYTLWATLPDHVAEVGCIYSAQGFEFDYCGVILGNDLVWREGSGWVASRSASLDPKIARRKLEPPELLALVQHTYRVLATRGMRGTYLYSTDWETRRYVESLLKPSVGVPA